MSWYEFLVPTLVIALAVRLEATIIGPYWAWVELIPEVVAEDRSAARTRRNALTFASMSLWPRAYDLVDGAILGIAAAGLLLWPLVFHGLPWGISGLRLLLLYSSLALAFGSSGWFGGYVARFARTEGGVAHFLADNAIGLVIGAVGTLFFSAVFDRASTSGSKARRSSHDE
jgi:hypothetical protein